MHVAIYNIKEQITVNLHLGEAISVYDYIINITRNQEKNEIVKRKTANLQLGYKEFTINLNVNKL